MTQGATRAIAALWRGPLAVLAAGVVGLLGFGCSDPAATSDTGGEIAIDGSSTVYPITEAAASAFRESVGSDVQITLSYVGTGGGFKRFAKSETDISNASRPIKPVEVEACAEAGVEFIELPVAYDGLTVVVHPDNTWVQEMTIDDLRKIYVDDDPAQTWRDVRPAWPDRPIAVFAPGTASGTFDYFSEVVSGEDGIRGDMSVSENDNTLVRGVAGNPDAIGFFGCAYYFENEDKLKAVPIVDPKTGSAVLPDPSTIESGSYAPFSRPLFIYVNAESAERESVQAFVGYYLENAGDLAESVGYVRLPMEIYQRGRRNFLDRRTGTQFHDAQGEAVTGPVTEVYE